MAPIQEPEDPPERVTARLAGEAAGGDLERFGDLYCRVAPAIYAWASLKIGGSLSRMLDPEDVVQEVWCRAFARLPDYDADRATFRTWVFGIANHVLLEALRRFRVRGEGAGAVAVLAPEEVPEPATSVSRRVARNEGLRAFIAQVSALPQEERDLLLFHGLEGLNHAEVGAILGISDHAAAKRWQRLSHRLAAFGPLQGLLAN